MDAGYRLYVHIFIFFNHLMYYSFPNGRITGRNFKHFSSILLHNNVNEGGKIKKKIKNGDH